MLRTYAFGVKSNPVCDDLDDKLQPEQEPNVDLGNVLTKMPRTRLPRAPRINSSDTWEWRSDANDPRRIPVMSMI